MSVTVKFVTSDGQEFATMAAAAVHERVITEQTDHKDASTKAIALADKIDADPTADEDKVKAARLLRRLVKQLGRDA